MVFEALTGLGEAIGEFSGYAAGYGGRVMVEDKPSYKRIARWMDKKGTLTMFLMSTIPNPFFDIAGLAAGSVKMPMRAFFCSVLAGKTLKNMWLAGAASGAVALISHAA